MILQCFLAGCSNLASSFRFQVSSFRLVFNFYRAPFFLPWLYPQLTWRMETVAKELYLTFDDGPVKGPTDFVLQELEKFNAKATFFCIGNNIAKHPDVFRKIVEAGHAVGNHTYHHLSGWKTSNRDYLKNIEMCSQILAENDPSGAAGKEWGSSLFRPPYGRITRGQIKSLMEVKIIMWDVLTHDYAKSLSPVNCLKGSIAATRPGSIIVFHDSIKAEKNMSYAFPRYLEHFASKGYVFKILG